MIKRVDKEIVKLLILPVTGLFILVGAGGTAVVEYLSDEEDWDHWRRFNEPLIKMIPFYRRSDGN